MYSVWANSGWPFWFYLLIKFNEVEFFFNQSSKKAILCRSLKECLKFMVNSGFCLFCIKVSKNEIPRSICLITTTARAIIKNIGFVCIDGKQVTEIYCLIGTTDSFPTVNVFVVFCRPWLQTLNIWVIIVEVGILCTKIYAPLSNIKAISNLECNLNSDSFWQWKYRPEGQLVEL